LINLILGSQFLESVPIFSLLLLGTYVLMILAPYDQVLFATKNHRPLVVVNIFSLLIAISLSFWLVPIYQSLGTVMASVTAWIFGGFWHLILVRKRLQISLYHQLPLVVLPAVIILIVLQYPQSLVIKLALSILSIPIYYLTLFKLKIITKLDFKYLKTLFKPK